jgi:phage gp36-like protein
VTYATQQDMERYFGATEVLIAADRDGDGEADTNVIQTALDSATQELDSYVGVRYTLPLQTTPPPEILTHICCDVAMYRMSVNTGSMTDEKRTRYEDAIKWLAKLAAGNVTLGYTETEAETSEGSMETSSDNSARLFTRSKMQGLL